MCNYSTKELAILREIRKCLAYKVKYAPVSMSVDEFSQWQDRHRNYYLHSGYLSIWDGIEVPSGYDEVVIQKRHTRNGANPYLVFRDVETFHEYCRNAHFLGVESFALLENKFSRQIKSFAEEYHVPESAYDRLQSELERFMGLNFMADVSAQPVSDRQIYGSLYNYFKCALQQKAVSVFGKYGMEIDIEAVKWDAAISLEDTPEVICVAHADLREDKVDPHKLFEKIIDLMDRLESDKDTRYDLKDNLLSQVIRTDRATNEFISSYYSALKDRRSVWRPAAFSYQILYAHDKGTKYLKNPVFIQACGNMSIGGMMESQINMYNCAHISEMAYQNMLSLWQTMKNENVQDTTLLACAGDAGQIGKALSKELRTEEAKGSLARALLVSVLDKSEDCHFGDMEGVDYHE